MASLLQTAIDAIPTTEAGLQAHAPGVANTSEQAVLAGALGQLAEALARATADEVSMADRAVEAGVLTSGVVADADLAGRALTGGLHPDRIAEGSAGIGAALNNVDPAVVDGLVAFLDGQLSPLVATRRAAVDALVVAAGALADARHARSMAVAALDAADAGVMAAAERCNATARRGGEAHGDTFAALAEWERQRSAEAALGGQVSDLDAILLDLAADLAAEADPARQAVIQAWIDARQAERDVAVVAQTAATVARDQALRRAICRHHEVRWVRAQLTAGPASADALDPAWDLDADPAPALLAAWTAIRDAADAALAAELTAEAGWLEALGEAAAARAAVERWWADRLQASGAFATALDAEIAAVP